MFSISVNMDKRLDGGKTEVTSNKDHWSYVAGLIDSDGTFVISRQWRTQSKCWNYSFKLKICSVEEVVAKWLVRFFGGVYYTYVPKKASYKTSYIWTIKGRKNREQFILAVLPYLGVTHEQASEALQYIRLPENANIPEAREQAYFRMQALNHSDSKKIKVTGQSRDSYMAGLLDGDGTFSISKDTRRIKPYYQATIRLANKDLNMHKWAVQFFGGSIKNRDANGVATWQLSGDGVRGAVDAVIPFLIIKKERAETVWQFLSAISDEEKEQHYLRLQRLNQRGTSESPQAHTSSNLEPQIEDMVDSL